MYRRTFLQLAGTVTLSSVIPQVGLSGEDDAFLDDLERRACLYFSEQVGAHSGQVLDRAAAINTPLTQPVSRDPRLMASIAATGFGLTALCIADHRRYQPRSKLLDQVRRTLRFHLNNMPHEHGFLFHFNDVDLGGSFRGSEASSIDTSIFLCGALTARAHFGADAEIASLVAQLYERVDWAWMLNGPNDGKTTLAMGWRNGAFLSARWSHYCELMMIYLLAMASPTHPINPACWSAWTRPRIRYGIFDYISGDDPLFTHQYSHAWFDFRNHRDRFADYFANSILATRAHQAFCLTLGKPYSDDYWGISASDSAHGYTAWGGPDVLGRPFGGVDGSVVPNATAGSLPFLPGPCLRVQRALKSNYPKAWGRYGFCDVFHPETGYYDGDVLGIDLGITLLMAENLRSGFVWNTFAKNQEVALAFSRAGLRRI